MKTLFAGLAFTRLGEQIARLQSARSRALRHTNSSFEALSRFGRCQAFWQRCASPRALQKKKSNHC